MIRERDKGRGLKKGVIREGEGIKDLGIMIRECYGTKRGGDKNYGLKLRRD